MLDIRRVTESELSDIARLEEICFSEPWSENSLRLLTEGDNVGIAVYDGEALVGYGGMTCVLDEGAVTNIAVHPDHRRMGIGRTVVRELLSEAKKRNILHMFLEVRESNQGAIALYIGEGFHTLGVRKNFYRQPVENALQMEFVF